MEEKEILIDGLMVNYKIGGSGPTILILHGWGSSSDSWLKVIKILEKKFFVVCPDMPGFGKSKTPKRGWDLNDYIQWLKNFVENFKGEKFFLLGHSFGGRVAIKFSLFYPEKVKGLILVASAGIKIKWGIREKIIFFTAKIGNAIFSPYIFNRLKESARKIFYRVFRVKDWSRANGFLKETMKNILEEDLLPHLEKINVKTYIIWGEKDKILPLKYAFIFKEKIANAQLKILPEVAHSPQLENPKELAKIITKILAKEEKNFSL